MSAEAREHEQFDFKQQAGPRLQEHAKDIAAMANGLGGVIVFGARFKDGALSHPGLSAQYAQALTDEVEKANKDLCTPACRIDPISIALANGRVLLAINIEPSVVLVGAQMEKSVDAPWRFPVRSGSHTRFVGPGDARMFEDARSRRVFIQLHAVAEADRRNMVLHLAQAMGATILPLRAPTPADLLEICPDSARFRVVFPQDGIFRASEVVARIPLREISDLWRNEAGRVVAIVEGTIQGGDYVLRLV